MPKIHNVHLEWYEWEMALGVGLRRNIRSIYDGLKPDFGASAECWNAHMTGACAEYAFAKFMHLPWDGSVNAGKAPDVAGIQVRSSTYASAHLRVRATDNPDHKFVLVTGGAFDQKAGIFVYTVRGWAFGHEGMHGRFRKPAEDEYWLPQDQLREMSEIQ